MKKIGVLMQEIGFNKNAPDSVKEAFIKHLIKASTGVNVTTPSEAQEIRENPDKIVALKNTPQQLSFDFLGEQTRQKPSKKAVS
ncbi:hypothetical protein D3C87_1047690 [compost metagenome]